MAITIVSGNLNIYGDAGHFEADPSTWGSFFPVTNAAFQVTRSNAQKFSGLYSVRFKALLANIAGYDIGTCRAIFTAGKKYILKAKVFIPSSAPLAAGAGILSIYNGGVGLYFNIIDSTTKTITQATDTWVELSLQVAWLINTPDSFWVKNSLEAACNVNGMIYVDDFEVYEYVESEDPGPIVEGETFDSVFFSRNPIVLSKTAPVGWGVLTNFRLYNEVRVQDDTGSGVYVTKDKIELPPDVDGNVKFYLRQAFPFPDVLKAVVPAYNTTEIVRLTDRIKFFKNYSGQLTGTDVVPGVLTASNRLLVMLGGINKQKYPGLNFFTTYLPANKKFMTWAPVEKLVDRQQEDYLNFWVYGADTTTVKLRAKAYYDDGTNQTQIVKTLTPVLYGYLLQIPSGPLNSGVADIDPTKNIIRYELSLLDQDDALISEVRTYKVSLVRHPLTRFIMMLNSLGTYEVIMFTGQAAFTTEYQREVIQRFLPDDYTVEDGEFATGNTSLQEKVNYSTGYFKGRYAKAWQQYMKDVLLSRVLFDVTSGDRIPISVTTTNLDGGSDQDFMRFARLDVQKSFVDDSYTPDEI